MYFKILPLFLLVPTGLYMFLFSTEELQLRENYNNTRLISADSNMGNIKKMEKEALDTWKTIYNGSWYFNYILFLIKYWCSVFQLDFEIFRIIASFIKTSSGHSLIIKLISIKFFRTIWQLEALKSLHRSPGYKKNQLVLCKNYVLQW